MNGTLTSTEKLLTQLVTGIGHGNNREVGVCVPCPFLSLAQSLLRNSSILLGSQNVADHPSGAFTGEVSAAMLKEFDCELAIVGHSERRGLYAETSELVAKRYCQAIATGLTPIICVGETLEQRDSGTTFDVIDQQLNAVLTEAGVESLRTAIIAYEPVWAIGTGKTATSEQAQEVHAHIRNKIADIDKLQAEAVRILYGGSVKPENAADLFSMPDIDGGLIGGASLDAQSFVAICSSI